MKASLVVNPVAGTNVLKKIAEIEFLLKEKATLTTFIARKKGEAFLFAKKTNDMERIIIAGGDGTIHEVINGLMSANKNNQGSIPLAILPLGTTNVLAKELGIPDDLGKAAHLALSGKARKISLGRINGRYFSLMAGIGFDGETVLGVQNCRLKKIIGKAAYVISGISVLGTYDPPLVTIKTSGGETSGYTAIIGNAHCYGGNFSVTPHASVFEAELDICLYKGKTRRDLLRFVFGILSKKHLDFQDVHYWKETSVEVVSDREVHIQVDGDYFGTLPVKIDSVKDAVSLIS